MTEFQFLLIFNFIPFFHTFSVFCAILIVVFTSYLQNGRNPSTATIPMQPYTGKLSSEYVNSWILLQLPLHMHCHGFEIQGHVAQTKNGNFLKKQINK
jgi:hypothetical protein